MEERIIDFLKIAIMGAILIVLIIAGYKLARSEVSKDAKLLYEVRVNDEDLDIILGTLDEVTSRHLEEDR